MLSTGEALRTVAIKTVGFTGHRWLAGDKRWASERLRDAIARAMGAGAAWFISGGAPGSDIEFIELASDTRESRFPDGVSVVAALPFPSFWEYYTERKGSSIIDVVDLESRVDVIVSVNCNPYEVWKMHARNHWIVDESDAIVAIYDGRGRGGTHKTLAYARRAGKPIYWINPTDNTARWVT